MTTNVITEDQLIADIEEIGRASGAGNAAETQIRSLLKVFEGGWHRRFDLNPNKRGQGVDDAQFMAEKYVKAQNAQAVFNAKANNQQKLISTFRTMIKFSGWTKGGNGEPMSNINQLMTIRQTLRKTPAEAKKLDDAANTVLKYARQQMKRDTLMDEEELKGLCYRKTPDLQTAEEIIQGMTKQLDKLIAGAAAKGTAQANTPHVIGARDSLRNELKAIATARGKAKGPAAP